MHQVGLIEHWKMMIEKMLEAQEAMQILTQTQ
jgi:hypothetical protein